MTKEMMDKIKKFAHGNWSLDYDDPNTVVAEHEECAVTNPWMDRSARFPLDDVEAVKEWGLATVIDFCEKAQEVIEKEKKKAMFVVTYEGDTYALLEIEKSKYGKVAEINRIAKENYNEELEKKYTWFDIYLCSLLNANDIEYKRIDFYEI